MSPPDPQRFQLLALRIGLNPLERRNIETFDSTFRSKKRSFSPRKYGKKCTCFSPTRSPFPSFPFSHRIPCRETPLCSECRKADFYSNFSSMGNESISETSFPNAADSFSPANEDPNPSKFLQNRGNLSDSAYLLSKVNMSALNGDGFIVSTPVNPVSESHGARPFPPPTSSKTWDPARAQLTAEELWRRIHNGSFVPSELMTSGLRACQRRERLLLDPEIRDLWTRPQA